MLVIAWPLLALPAGVFSQVSATPAPARPPAALPAQPSSRAQQPLACDPSLPPAASGSRQHLAPTHHTAPTHHHPWRPPAHQPRLSPCSPPPLQGYFTMWIIIALIWGMCAAAVCMLLPW